MTRRFVDLSIYLEDDVMSNPPAIAPKIQYFTHQNTFEQIAPFFPGLKKEDPTARAGRSRWCSCQRTTAPISMRLITSIRR
jgi:hypothetical protein